MTTTTEQQVTDFTRILDTGELLTLAQPQAEQMHLYAAHPHGGYRVLVITPDPAGGLPHVGSVRLGPSNLHGWLFGDLRDSWHELAEDTVTETTDYGTLTDYVTGEAIRPATAAEHTRSLAAGETGAYEDEDGRAVFVAGGPES